MTKLDVSPKFVAAVQRPHPVSVQSRKYQLWLADWSQTEQASFDASPMLTKSVQSASMRPPAIQPPFAVKPLASPDPKDWKEARACGVPLNTGLALVLGCPPMTPLYFTEFAVPSIWRWPEHWSRPFDPEVPDCSQFP